MSAENYITSSCIISKEAVYKNGLPVFANHDANLNEFLLSVYKYLDLKYARFYRMDNLCKLGWLASEVLLKGDFNADKYSPEEIGIILSNSNSSLDTDMKYAQSIHDIPSPSVFVYTLPNILIGEICIRNQCKGETAFFLFDRFDASFIIQYVNNLMKNDILQVCICGWVDIVLNEYKAVLFLVEKDNNNEKPIFSKENVDNLFQTETNQS